MQIFLDLINNDGKIDIEVGNFKGRKLMVSNEINNILYRELKAGSIRRCVEEDIIPVHVNFDDSLSVRIFLLRENSPLDRIVKIGKVNIQLFYNNLIDDLCFSWKSIWIYNISGYKIQKITNI